MVKETESIYSLFWKESTVIHYLFKRKQIKKHIKMSLKFCSHLFYKKISLFCLLQFNKNAS